MLISSVQQNDSVTHICIDIDIFFSYTIFSIMVYHSILNLVPCVIFFFFNVYNWHLLGITNVLFLLVKLYPEMNVCERMSISMTTTCNPVCALLTRWAFLWSTCGKWRGNGLGAEGVWFPPAGSEDTWGLRGHWGMHDWSPKELLIMQDEGYRATQWILASGARKKEGRDVFHPFWICP